MQLPHGQRRRRRQAALGCLLALGSMLALAEVFLRFFPPRDLHPYLGERSPLVGHFKADPALGVTYESFDAFAADNAKALKLWLPLQSPPEKRPIWAMFGSSFVHMRGMLADTARKSVADHAIFNLGKNESVPVRVAQIRLLLENGFQPERIFFQIMPLDFMGLTEQPLASYYVTTRGALTYRPKAPAVGGNWILNSRLALTAWCRTGMQKGDASSARNRLGIAVPDGVLRDTRQVFTELARVSQAHRAPVTVLLIPNYEQIWQTAPCGFQDILSPMLTELGFDVCDPRDAFMHHQNRADLFIPDKHFSPEGNRLLLAELRAHMDRVARSEQDAKGVRAIPTSARPSKTQGQPLPSPQLRGRGAGGEGVMP